MRVPLSPIPTFSPRPPLRADAYPDDIGDLAAGMSDEQAIRKIGQRTTATGRVVTVAVILGAVALSWFYMKRSEAYEARTFFARHWAYFETSTPKLAHPTPIQGSWTVDGLGLPRAIVAKVYAENAVRVFALDPPGKAPESRMKRR